MKSTQGQKQCSRNQDLEKICTMSPCFFITVLKFWIIISYAVPDIKVCSLTMNDFKLINVSARIHYLYTGSALTDAAAAEANCGSLKAEMTLFETNQEYANVLEAVLRLGRLETWIKLNRTDEDNDMVYEHRWRREQVNKTVWVSGEPADCGRMVNASVPCCPVLLYYSKGLAYQSCTRNSSYLCSPRNECLDGTANCSQICKDETVGYTCSCRPGYTLASNNRSCSDVDECKTKNNNNNNLCPQVCSNTDGSYTCTCYEGYLLTGVNGTCADINECLSSPCQQVCTNTNGSFLCGCKSGYTLSGDKVSCVDVNECEHYTTNQCQQHCVNTDGSYVCQCEIGYALSPDGRNCTDVDECLDSPCQQVCNNTHGSYACSLDDGYALNASYARCNASQDTCDQACVVDTHGSIACQCYSGYSLQPDNRTCVDVDECGVAYLSNCTGPCTNTDGGYFCGCPTGYRQNQTDCIDIDECADQIDNCSQLCNNTMGSYNCACKDGYRLDNDMSTCVDIDECKEDLHACNHTCINTRGSFNCACYRGYYLNPVDKTTCHDIDECNTTTKLCDHYCNNTHGSFFCSCMKGYTLSGKYCLVRKLSNYCPCSCLYLDQRKLFTVQYAKKQLAQLKRQLGLVNSNLTSYKMQKSCQDDQRSSAESVGIAGVASIVAVLGLVVIPDVLFVVGWVIVQIKGRQKRSALGKI